jgi:hypothetical protein
MRIYGLSQSTGVERMLGVERAGDGVLLTISDGGGSELAGVVVPSAGLMSAVVDHRPGGSSVEGTSPAGGTMRLDIEVRRNEVWLRAHAAPEPGWDVAVGLDDFQDALEGAVADA